jgi:16S rRNA (cytidine1402-2'-O)-methyltransferase
LSGFPLALLSFDGFFPRTDKERAEKIRAAQRRGGSTTWYESPHRLAATLRAFERETPDARLFVVRELTKKFEQRFEGTAAEILAMLPSPLKGEVALVMQALTHRPQTADHESDASTLDQRIDALLLAGETTAAVAKTLSQAGLGERKDVYARASERRRSMKSS